MKRIILTVIISLVCVLLIGVAVFSTHVVAGDERGILLENDAFVRVVNPGLVFLTSKSERLERVLISETTINRYPLAIDADQRSARLHLRITFHHDPERAEIIYRSYGTDDAYAFNAIGMCSEKRLISPRLEVISEAAQAAAKSVFERYTATDFENDTRPNLMHDRDALNSALEHAIKEALADEPIIVDKLQIEKIDYTRE